MLLDSQVFNTPRRSMLEKPGAKSMMCTATIGDSTVATIAVGVAVYANVAEGSGL